MIISYPVRINRYLYLKNICSRREADKLILEGKVKINGKTALLGQQVEQIDKVNVDSSHVKSKKIYVLFNKPKGVVSHNPQNREQGPEKYLKQYGVSLHPVGRLDKASRGLMLFTNDGTIVDKMLNPKHDHEKEYEVTVDKRVEKNFLIHMREGVQIENYRTKPARLRKIDSRNFSIVLTEGKKHQIRRMCAALGYQVKELKRTRIGTLRLGNLRSGKTRLIEGKELLELKKSIAF